MKKLIILALGVLALAGCPVDTGSSTKKEMELTEANHTKLVKVVPPPKLVTSQERRNLVKRLTRFNSETKVSYIYLISYGKVMAFYTVKGKVSSVNSLLTTPDQIIRARHGSGVYSTHKIASPDLDGSYGSNGDAIFFFDANDTYIEWSGSYMLCDKPLKLTTPPALVIQVKDD